MRQLLAKIARARKVETDTTCHFVGEYLAGVSPSVWTEDGHAALVRPLNEADQLAGAVRGFVLLVGDSFYGVSRRSTSPGESQTTIEAYQATLEKLKLD